MQQPFIAFAESIEHKLSSRLQFPAIKNEHTAASISCPAKHRFREISTIDLNRDFYVFIRRQIGNL